MTSPSVFTHSILHAQQLPQSIYIIYLALRASQRLQMIPEKRSEKYIGHSYRIMVSSQLQLSIFCFVSLHCRLGMIEDACQCPNNVIHRVLPLPLNLVHSCAYLYGV